MKKARIFLILGIWVAILPYLGFPASWKNMLFFATGLGLAYFGYVLYKEYKISDESNKKNVDTFSENKDFIVNTTEENK